MGKLGKNLKRKRLLSTADASPPSSSTPSDPLYLAGLLTPSEISQTTKTLSTLAATPDLLLKNKQELKGLRTEVFNFMRINSEISGVGEGTGISGRIGGALKEGRWIDAEVLLAEMRIRGIVPKLGALQRWVRDCDAASSFDGSFSSKRVLKTLEAILRLGNLTTEELEPVCRKPEFVLREQEKMEEKVEEVDEVEKERLKKKFRLLENTPAEERAPPNHHPALLFTSELATIPLVATLPVPVTRHEVPNVPGAFLLANILTPEEAKAIITATEAVGFTPDQPIGADDSILAHNLYWLADETFLANFFERIKEFLPQEMEGGKLTGLNARFRVYRYVPGAIYRPHIDGAWPKSGIDKLTGKYLFDSATKEAPEWSRLTFLLYLNEGFMGGNTTFFLPSEERGQLNAFGVKPFAGCSLVFPHGDAKGSLLHEGSPVEEGVKYVIRTEVLYESFRGARD